jgi:hypothetical protein
MRTAKNISLHYRNCNLCEAICGIKIAVQNESSSNGSLGLKEFLTWVCVEEGHAQGKVVITV